MTSPPTPPPLPDNIPSAISVSRPTAFGAQRVLHTPDQERNTIPPPQNTHENGHEPPGPSDYDYTENAPQAVVDAVAIERAKREQEGPPEMMVGSWTSWAGSDNGVSHLHFSCIHAVKKSNVHVLLNCS